MGLGREDRGRRKEGIGQLQILMCWILTVDNLAMPCSQLKSYYIWSCDADA